MPVTTPLVHAKAAVQIGAYINDHGLVPGDKLPSERLLARLLGMGRSSLREGLRVLEAGGQVQVQPGKGVFVVGRSSDAAAVASPAAKASLLHVLEIRRTLEILAAEIAARRATPQQIAHIERALSTLESSPTGVSAKPDPDWAFHAAVYAASGNPLLIELMTVTLVELQRFWNTPLGRSDLFASTLPLHRPTLEAIRLRQPRKARLAVLELMRRMEEAIIDAT